MKELSKDEISKVVNEVSEEMYDLYSAFINEIEFDDKDNALAQSIVDYTCALHFIHKETLKHVLSDLLL